MSLEVIFLHKVNKMELGNFMFCLSLPTKDRKLLHHMCNKMKKNGVELAVCIFCQSCAATENECKCFVTSMLHVSIS